MELERGNGLDLRGGGLGRQDTTTIEKGRQEEGAQKGSRRDGRSSSRRTGSSFKSQRGGGGGQRGAPLPRPEIGGEWLGMRLGMGNGD